MAAFTAENAFSGFSVDDSDAAREFYGTTLGLDVEVNAMGFLDLRLPRGGSVLVYAKPNHTPASFTILNFPVADVDAAVRAERRGDAPDALDFVKLLAQVFEALPLDGAHQFDRPRLGGGRSRR